MRLDWTQANAHTGRLHPSHIGVFATMEARIKRHLCSSSLRQLKDHTFGILLHRLVPSVFCLRQGLHVQLLEWVPASSHTGNCGIDEYVLAISEAVATIAAIGNGAKPFMIGHSLGGTLAAIYGAFQPETIKGLVLLGAPLCFEPSKSQFRDALISLVPRNISEDNPFPGSLLSHASALASPSTFIWSRLIDAALSVGDPFAMEIMREWSVGHSMRFLFQES